LSGLFPCFFCGGGLTQAKNMAARATQKQKQVPVARSPPASRPADFDWTARPQSKKMRLSTHHTDSDSGKIVHHHHASPQVHAFCWFSQWPLGLCFVFVFLCFSGEARFLVSSRFF
jgi:hypothetical protein